MELIKSPKNKRTILMVQDSKHDLTELKNILSQKYNIYFFEKENSDFQSINDMIQNMSAAIICASDASANDYALFKWIGHNGFLSTAPLIIYCNSEYDYSVSKKCLELGAVEVISEPLYDDIVIRRVENSIKIKDSASFYEIERMLRELPSNIYLKDINGRYVFATHYWHHLDHSDDPEWTIRGKTDFDIRKDKENALKAMESDRELMRTGKGTNYVIEINEDNVQEFFEIIKRPVYDENKNITGIIALINNVTEMQLIRIDLEKRAMRDELTGVENRMGFEKFIMCLTNSNFPMSIISADCNNLKFINDTYGHIFGDDYIRMSTLVFKSVLPEDSKIFRTGGDEFIIFIPNTDDEKATEYIEKMKKEGRQFKIKDTCVSIAYGNACMKDSSENIKEIIDIADQKMYSDKKKSKRQGV